MTLAEPVQPLRFLRFSVLKLASVATAIALLSPALLTAQVDQRLAERVDGPTLEVMTVILRQAARVGLPSEPLIDKALEGSSRGAPHDMIVAAVRRLFDGMNTVRSVLGPGAGASELNAGALALRAGADVEAIEGLKLARPGGDLTTPFGVLVDLVAIGVPAEDAGVIVYGLTEKGHTDVQLLELQRQVVNDVINGYPPMIAASVRSGIPTAAPPPFGDVVAEGVSAAPQP